MRIVILFFCLLLFATSCKSAKSHSSKESHINKTTTTSKATKIVTYAKTFEGVRYQFGGTNKRGMDCSGLIFTAFKYENVLLPRISRDMAKSGKEIKLNNINIGDLLFFKTKAKQGKINHVGLVVSINNKNIKFIHATTSKGVITSTLNEPYWKNAFVKARRVL
jgi:cell wall-associated NlpC family hydrolase